MQLDCIALIDDDRTTNFLNKRLIEGSGLTKQVLTFMNGKEAMEYFTSGADDIIKPDLILLDINMPIMNGFQFLDAYGSLFPGVKEQVVVMLSSSEQVRDKSEAEKRGVGLYLVKPLTKENLVAIIEQHYA